MRKAIGFVLRIVPFVVVTTALNLSKGIPEVSYLIAFLVGLLFCVTANVIYYIGFMEGQDTKTKEDQ
ncbi:hypothetical protein LCGC14_1713800 [marine sediment metagenome]|uniref:Uncharacterized protein n=1 Tax=marine sediment metagenome TaxID=412755 RepID=A0A0F9HEX8_9ZZZZ